MVMGWNQLFERDRWWFGCRRDGDVRNDRILFNVEFRRRFRSGISIEFGFFHRRVLADEVISFYLIDLEFKDLIVFLIAEKDPFVRGRRFQNVLVIKPGKIDFHAREIPVGVVNKIFIVFFFNSKRGNRFSFAKFLSFVFGIDVSTRSWDTSIPKTKERNFAKLNLFPLLLLKKKTMKILLTTPTGISLAWKSILPGLMTRTFWNLLPLTNESFSVIKKTIKSLNSRSIELKR